MPQLREKINLFSSIESIDKRMRKVGYNLLRLDVQVGLVTNIHLSGTTYFVRAQAPLGSRVKKLIRLKKGNVKY